MVCFTGSFPFKENCVTRIIFSYDEYRVRDVKINLRTFLIMALITLVMLAWAPWLNDEEIHDRVLLEKADIDGSMGWVVYVNGTMAYQLICDYKVSWFPFGRLVASCEGGYYVTFWNRIIP